MKKSASNRLALATALICQTASKRVIDEAALLGQLQFSLEPEVVPPATENRPATESPSPAFAPPAEVLQSVQLLILDTDPHMVSLVRDVSGDRYPVAWARTLAEARAQTEASVSIVLADLRLGGEDLTGLLKNLKKNHPASVTLLTSATQDSSLLIPLINQGGIFRFLAKPVDKPLLERSLKTAIQHHANLKMRPTPSQTSDRNPRTWTSLNQSLQGIWRRLRT